MRVLDPVLAVSPHLDDAVFSCGALLARSAEPTVVSVCAGVPSNPVSVTAWDRASGFGTSHECVEARRYEDARALGTLGAVARWLDFLDDQYRSPASLQDIADAVGNEISRCGARTILIPMGLFHRDHVRVSEAAIRIMQARRGGSHWLAYADLPYATIPGVASMRLVELYARLGTKTKNCFEEPCSSAKERAVSCYQSQLRALHSRTKLESAMLGVAERYWRLR